MNRRKFIKTTAAVFLTGAVLCATPIPLGFWKPASSGASGPTFPFDSIESYSDGATLSGLNGGVNWAGAYVDRNGLTGIQAQDNAEGYTNGASLNGLNGGLGWGGAFVDR